MPRARLSALEAKVSRSTSGLVITKLDGATALASCVILELSLFAGMWIEAVGVAHQFVRPFGRQQIRLHQKVEEQVRPPFRISEAFVARFRFDGWPDLLAGQAARGITPKFQIGCAELGL